MNRIPVWTQAALLAALVVVAHLSLAPRVADLDAFYHIGHAAAYLEGSLFDTGLPWGTQSVIRDMGADLWWGFHLALLPFAALNDPVWGIRLAGVFLTLTLGAGAWWALRSMAIPHAWLWTAGLLVAVPNVLFRFLMVRPHVLSLGLSLVLVAALIRRRWVAAAAAAGATTWIHLSLLWMPLGIAGAFAMARAAQALRGEPAGRETATALAVVGSAVLAGVILRPHPLASLELAWIQIGELFTLKGEGVPLLFAGELLPLPATEFLRSAWAFALAWAAAVALFLWGWATGRRSLRDDVAALTLLLCSMVFLALTLASARRALVEWVVFGLPLVALAWRHFAGAWGGRGTLVAGLLLLAVHLPWTVHRHRLNVELAAFPPRTLQEAANWLEANTPPGSIVFHAHWDNFGPLVAHNRHNRYLSGMDPVFQYRHDPKRYWEFFWLSADIHADWTCDAFPCHEGTATSTYEVLTRHFDARWVLVEPRRNPKLTTYLLQDPRYALALATAHEAIFEILPQEGEEP